MNRQSNVESSICALTFFVRNLYLFLLWPARRQRSANATAAPLPLATSCRYPPKILLALLLISTPEYAAQWRGVAPLRSDKKAVRAQLGKPTFESVDRLEFSRREGRVVVFFYTAADTVELKLQPGLAGKVLLIYLYPKTPKQFDLQLLAKKVGRVGRGVTIEGEPLTTYDDARRGISYHFKNDATTVWRIVYYAPGSEFGKYRLKEPG